MSPRSTLDALLDQRDIEALLHRYATGIDTHDYDLIDTVFAPDGVMDYASLGGPTGPWTEVKDWAKESLAAFAKRQHFVTNVVVELDADGDAAHSIAYWRAPIGFERADGSWHVFESGGRYEDELVRTAEGWRIARRITHSEWMIGTLPEEMTPVGG